jgi:hypothetical protein
MQLLWTQMPNDKRYNDDYAQLFGGEIETTHLHILRDSAFELVFFAAPLEIHESRDLEVHKS